MRPMVGWKDWEDGLWGRVTEGTGCVLCVELEVDRSVVMSVERKAEKRVWHCTL